MRIADALAKNVIDRLDAEVLLGHLLGRDRAWLLGHGDDELDASKEESFAELVRRRAAGEPVAYLTGEKEFYGRAFGVRPGILVPRPCTEALVETALAMLDGRDVPPVREIDSGIVAAARTFGKRRGIDTIVDVGTGSGCIAVTLACERDGFGCIATDVSLEALETAQSNAERHGVAERIAFRKGPNLDVLHDLREAFLIVTNPPYVADEQLLGADVRAHEPMTALMGGGNDGADILRAIVTQAKAHPFCAGIVVECLSSQAGIVTES